MSWQDRPYSGENTPGELRIQFQRPSSAVTWLIIVNVAVFLADVIVRGWGVDLAGTLGLSLTGVKSYYIWQIFTYMFVHYDVWHLLMNMLGLYIFGSEFERHFGHERFLQFYVTCGLVGGLAYLLLGALKPLYALLPLVGASGAVYGLLIAAIIFFPHIRVVLIIFPMPVRVFGLIIAAILLLQFLSPGGVRNLGGEVCHLAGAATGLAFFYAWGVMPRIRFGTGGGSPVYSGRSRSRSDTHGRWARKQRRLAEEQAEVDRILAKVHDHGLQSLTWTERRKLSRATQRQKERESQLDRVDRL